MSDAIDDFYDTIPPRQSKPIDTYHLSKKSYLLTLPRELRDMILVNLVKSRHVTLL